MRASVGELALEIRVPRGSTRLAAELPALERVLHARLAAELAAAIEAVHDDSSEVIVVREAVARITLSAGERAFDHTMVETVSSAARDAIVALLDRADDETEVKRFASEAAYIGSFVIELLDGSPWDRWWFERLHRFRHDTARETIAALLADVETDCVGLFAWLEQRGRLADVIALIGATAARRFALGDDAESALVSQPPELAPLAAAAFAIASALGVDVLSDRQHVLIADYYRTVQALPSWRDRRALTSWVWELARWVVWRESRGALVVRHDGPRHETLRAVLGGSLDWLDGTWIVERVSELTVGEAETRALTPSRAEPPLLLPRHAALLERLASLVTMGAKLEPTEPRDQLVVRLVAMLQLDEGGVSVLPDRAFLSILDDVVTAFVISASRGHAVEAPAAGQDPSVLPAAALRMLRVDEGATIRKAEAHGPAAAKLLRALSGATPDQHQSTRHAGLWLLVRPISDLRLDRLAERAGVPFATLLAGLAEKVLGATRPWDDVTSLWLGALDADPTSLDPTSLRTLQSLVLRSLIGLHHVGSQEAAVHRFEWRDETFIALSDESGSCWPLTSPASHSANADLMNAWRDAAATDVAIVEAERPPTTDLVDLTPIDDVSPEVEVLITSIATCVIRAMSRWLPGLSTSSAPFLVRNCLRRAGSVHATDDEIAVRLDRAPLDVVLEMAGSYATVPETTWLGRRVRFSIA